MTWEIIRNNFNKSWVWKSISRNPNMTWKIIKDNPNKPWYWSALSYNEFKNDRIQWDYGKNWQWLLDEEMRIVIMIFWVCLNISTSIYLEIPHLIAHSYVESLYCEN